MLTVGGSILNIFACLQIQKSICECNAYRFFSRRTFCSACCWFRSVWDWWCIHRVARCFQLHLSLYIKLVPPLYHYIPQMSKWICGYWNCGNVAPVCTISQLVLVLQTWPHCTHVALLGGQSCLMNAKVKNLNDGVIRGMLTFLHPFEVHWILLVVQHTILS